MYVHSVPHINFLVATCVIIKIVERRLKLYYYSVDIDAGSRVCMVKKVALAFSFRMVYELPTRLKYINCNEV